MKYEAHDEFPQELFTCSCGNIEHQLVLTSTSWRYEDEEVNREVWVYVHMNPMYKLWDRIVLAVKYIFGHRSRYGEFANIALTRKDVIRLREALTKAEQLTWDEDKGIEKHG